ncbi:hypothetical protein B9Z55_025330 [Caenorhabditis nigoni]|uniref:Uncharacterized protein n=1 Tax=Caenorhabditis nigoni TaxID=1611254 RepID=A0A2G5SYR0_9PELO|nr:hypothetical protein B9Z55_025330 [Caenorhabditis nigoni]
MFKCNAAVALVLLNIKEVDTVMMKMVRDQRVEESTTAILRKMQHPPVTSVIYSYLETDDKAVSRHEKRDDDHSPEFQKFSNPGREPDLHHEANTMFLNSEYICRS